MFIFECVYFITCAFGGIIH